MLSVYSIKSKCGRVRSVNYNSFVSRRREKAVNITFSIILHNNNTTTVARGKYRVNSKQNKKNVMSFLWLTRELKRK